MQTVVAMTTAPASKLLHFPSQTNVTAQSKKTLTASGDPDSATPTEEPR